MTLIEASEAGVGVDDLTRFVAEEWAWPVILNEPRFYEWQLRSSPLSKGRDRSVVMLAGDSEIVGFMGVNPRLFRGPGWEYVAAETTTWVINPRLRGTGIAGRLFAFLQERYGVITGGRGTDLSWPPFFLAGFKRLHRLPRMIRVLDPGALGAAGVVSTLGERLLPRAEALRSMAPYRAASRGLSDQALTQAERFVGYRRDRSHLVWRYHDHPVFTYEDYTVEHDAGESGVVVRVHQSPELCAIHVVELFSDVVGMPAVAHFLDDLGRDRGAAFIDFYGVSSAHLGPLWATGWLSNDDDREVRIADRLSPIELMEPCTTSVLLWSRERMGAILDFGNLLLTKGDMDLDRPPYSFVAEHGWRAMGDA